VERRGEERLTVKAQENRRGLHVEARSGGYLRARRAGAGAGTQTGTGMGTTGMETGTETGTRDGHDGNGNGRLIGHLTGGPIIHLFLGAGFAFAFLGAAFAQGLTLVHFSSQLERFFLDRGCA